MISKTLASLSAIVMTLSVFSVTVGAMNYAASQQIEQEVLA